MNRRTAMRAGITLNEVAEMYCQLSKAGLISSDKANSVLDAVRVANEIIYQYNALPAPVREHYKVSGGEPSGVYMHDLPQE